MRNPPQVERVGGALVAGAVADALGWPNEPNSARVGSRAPLPTDAFQGWVRFSGTRWMPYEEPIGPGQYSDDTQLTVCVARAHLAGSAWLDRLRDVEIPAWLAYERGGGRAVKSSARAWAAGRSPWDRTTKAGHKVAETYFRSGANGVAMRVFPHVVVAQSFQDAHAACIADGRLTHGHTRAFVGAAVHAYASWHALNWDGALDYGGLMEAVKDGHSEWGRPPEALEDDPGWTEEFERFHKCAPTDAWLETCDEVRELIKVGLAGLSEGSLVDERDVLGRLGCLDPTTRGSGIATAVGALFLASRFAAEPLTAVRVSCSMVDADTDTLGSMVGQLVGAVHGVGFLGSLGEEVQDAMFLKELANALVMDDAQSPGATHRVSQSAVSRWLDGLSSVGKKEHEFLDGRWATVVSSRELVSRSPTVLARVWTVQTKDGQTLFPLAVRRIEADETPARQTSLLVEPAASIQRLGFRRYVRDLRRSRAFYEQVLGLPPTRVQDRSVTYQEALTLAEVPEDRFQIGTGSVVVMEMHHVEAVLARLRRKGITVRPLESSTQAFRCADPDGHLVELRSVGEGA